jgi:hypothetical protein
MAEWAERCISDSESAVTRKLVLALLSSYEVV